MPEMYFLFHQIIVLMFAVEPPMNFICVISMLSVLFAGSSMTFLKQNAEHYARNTGWRAFFGFSGI